MISDTIRYVGVNDRELDLFEGQFAVPNGMAYNSYLILDSQIAVVDSVDARFAQMWLDQIHAVLAEQTPAYLIVQHMEPDHSGSIQRFMEAYPEAKIVASQRAFSMMKQFYDEEFADCRIVVGDGSILSLGSRTLTFVSASMVHWPEVIMTYDDRERVLFSADAFGKFGALDAEEDWLAEARRYYIGIVGKYGVPVQALLKKVAEWDIRTICPLHGPVLAENLPFYLNCYNTWSTYGVEEDDILIAYTSVYGHTKQAVEQLAEKLRGQGCTVVVHDLARCDMFEAVADAFCFRKMVLATTTYNGDIFPFMREFLQHLVARNFSNRIVAFMENGSWAPAAARKMKQLLQDCSNLTYVEPMVTIRSALNEESSAQLEALVQELNRTAVPEEGVEEPQEVPQKKYVCGICGYEYAGDTLPEGFVCPLCKCGGEKFEEVV